MTGVAQFSMLPLVTSSEGSRNVPFRFAVVVLLPCGQLLVASR